MKRDRNIVILKKIIQYSNEISLTIRKLELDFEKFNNDFIAKNAISMCVLQIGEMSNKLSDDLKTTYNKIPWRQVISLRHRATHDYESMDMDTLWGVAVNNVPELKQYCEAILSDIENNPQNEVTL